MELCSVKLFQTSLFFFMYQCEFKIYHCFRVASLFLPFCYGVVFYRGDLHMFIPSLPERQIGCLWFLTVVSKAAIMFEGMLLCLHEFTNQVGKYPGNCGKSTLSFGRTCQTFLQSAHSISHPQQ